MKKTVAVFFGGRSVEHDVSVLTALQFIEALNPLKYDPFPVYVDPMGQFWGGSPLLDRSNYPINLDKISLTRLHLDIAASQDGKPAFTSHRQKSFGRVEVTHHYFDVAVPAIHGTNGEDGSLQGLFDFTAIPYAGCRTLAAATTMDKAFTKSVLRAQGINCLPELVLKRPAGGLFITDEALATALEDPALTGGFPFIVKPCHLGSSVGVSKADNTDDLMAGILSVFRMDHSVMIEPFVTPLTEYNVAVRRLPSGEIVTSAIEEPKRESDLLDFQNKYMRGSKSGKKLGPKVGGTASEGMASLGRTLNPDTLSVGQEEQIRRDAALAFDILDLAGSVRIDFLCNQDTGEIWLNEINTVPGSFAYFLWEAADPAVSFLDLTAALVEEGLTLTRERKGDTGAAQGKASIFSGI